MTARRPHWPTLALLMSSSSLLVAVILFLVLPDQRWLAGIVAAMAVFEAVFFGLVVPRLTRETAAEQLDRMNAEAESAAHAEDRWA